MAKTIYTRSPFYVQLASSEDAVTCTIDVDSSTIYTLNRETIDGYATFEISELVRDYIQPTYDLNEGVVEVDVTLDDGVASPTTYNYIAVDGYKLYSEGIQSESNVSSSNVVAVTPVNGERRILVSDVMDSKVGRIQPGSSNVAYSTIDPSDAPSIVILSNTIMVDEIDCSKYEVIPCRFINKYGVHQMFFFNLKFVEKIDAESFSYNRSLVNYTNMSLDNNAHSMQRVVTGGKQSFTLNTPFLDEYYNQTIEELMFSEYVWIYVNSFWTPVHVKTQSLEKKTHVNDKLIQYTIQMDSASTYLNTIR